MKKLIICLMLGSFFLHTYADNVPFILKNNTPRAIYVLIPGVMNPTLSPFSGSGVSLEIGQKIYFVYKGEEYVLLEVNESLTDKKLSVSKLIRKRKKELGLK